MMRKIITTLTLITILVVSSMAMARPTIEPFQKAKAIALTEGVWVGDQFFMRFYDNGFISYTPATNQIYITIGTPEENVGIICQEWLNGKKVPEEYRYVLSRKVAGQDYTRVYVSWQTAWDVAERLLNQLE